VIFQANQSNFLSASRSPELNVGLLQDPARDGDQQKRRGRGAMPVTQAAVPPVARSRLVQGLRVLGISTAKAQSDPFCLRCGCVAGDRILLKGSPGDLAVFFSRKLCGSDPAKLRPYKAAFAAGTGNPDNVASSCSRFFNGRRSDLSLLWRRQSFLLRRALKQRDAWNP